MLKMRTFLMSLIIITALAACSGEIVETLEPGNGDEPTQQPDTGAPSEPGDGEVSDALVSSIQLNMMESFPLQLSVTVSGNLPDGCTRLEEAEQMREGDTFFIVLPTSQTGAEVCTEALEPFEETYPIDIEGLEAGTYTVNVNGVEETFTLDQDNTLPREDDNGDGVMQPGGAQISFQAVEASAEGTITITGELPDGCTGYIEHAYTLEDETVTVTLTRNLPPDTICTMAITPYSYNFDLEGLTSGTTYTVIVNGEEAATFTAN